MKGEATEKGKVGEESGGIENHHLIVGQKNLDGNCRFSLILILIAGHLLIHECLLLGVRLPVDKSGQNKAL